MSNNEHIPDRDAPSYENPLYVEAARHDPVFGLLLGKARDAHLARQTYPESYALMTEYHLYDDLLRQAAQAAGYHAEI